MVGSCAQWREGGDSRSVKGGGQGPCTSWKGDICGDCQHHCEENVAVVASSKNRVGRATAWWSRTWSDGWPHFLGLIRSSKSASALTLISLAYFVK